MLKRNKKNAAATIQYPQVFHGEGQSQIRLAFPTGDGLTRNPSRRMLQP
jgi:hypothetical protein